MPKKKVEKKTLVCACCRKKTAVAEIDIPSEDLLFDDEVVYLCAKCKKKTVVVHTCFPVEEEMPSLCACWRRITRFLADRWVNTGIAVWISIGKRSYRDKICMLNGSAQRTPRAATIDRTHIIRAYASDHGLEDRVRIEIYGQINKEELAKLVRVVPSYEFDEGFDKDYGQSVLYIPGDQRTPGGIGKWIKK